jgi:hypothetical protein
VEIPNPSVDFPQISGTVVVSFGTGLRTIRYVGTCTGSHDECSKIKIGIVRPTQTKFLCLCLFGVVFSSLRSQTPQTRHKSAVTVDNVFLNENIVLGTCFLPCSSWRISFFNTRTLLHKNTPSSMFLAHFIFQQKNAPPQEYTFTHFVEATCCWRKRCCCCAFWRRNKDNHAAEVQVNSSILLAAQQVQSWC